jgi:hypothetical protein
MGQRQLRLRAQEINAEQLQSYLGREVDVYLSTGSSHHGILRQCNAEALLLEDLNAMWYNRRKHQHWYPLAEVTELVLVNATVF